jgi:hypothetical protein
LANCPQTSSSVSRPARLGRRISQRRLLVPIIVVVVVMIFVLPYLTGVLGPGSH